MAYPQCPALPSGYDPLAALQVDFKNTSNQVIGSLVTDSCGNFAGNVPSSATTAVSQPTGTAAISQPVSKFTVTTGQSPSLVSALPNNATYILSVVQDLGAGKMALTVSDSLTSKAVLGLNLSNLSFTNGSTALPFSSLVYGNTGLGQQDASVAMVMDASGSMADSVSGTGKLRYQIASMAGHTLLDGLVNGSDEVGAILFDGAVSVANDAHLGTYTWVGTAQPTVSASGLTKNILGLRPVVDLYNRRSAIYTRNTAITPDPVHPGSANYRTSSSYKFGGGTAFYSATQAGLNLLDQASNPRKVVVAMTDGQDNAGSSTLSSVITSAKNKGIPVYAVAFGSRNEVDETSMQKLANDTGGEYKRVEGLDLTGLFQGIQTGIRFQYVASLNAAPAAGSNITITVTVAGAAPVSRTLTIR